MQGAEGVKTPLEAGFFGGEEGEWYDKNYHQIGDDLNNLNMTAWEVNTKVRLLKPMCVSGMDLANQYSLLLILWRRMQLRLRAFPKERGKLVSRPSGSPNVMHFRHSFVVRRRTRLDLEPGLDVVIALCQS